MVANDKPRWILIALRLRAFGIELMPLGFQCAPIAVTIPGLFQAANDLSVK